MTDTEAPFSHPHESQGRVPDRLPAADVRALSRIQPHRALLAIGTEWAAIVLTILACEAVFHPAIYVVAVIVIGARQHALTVIGHDASHFRLLPGKLANDVVGNVLCLWPAFAGVAGFRRFHGEHHRYTSVEGDGNRVLWHTHDADGNLAPLWVYPKTPAGVARALLGRVLGLTGPRWILRGFGAVFVVPDRPLLRALHLVFFSSLVAGLTLAGAWKGFLLYWIVPYSTWHIVIQYVRLICEHSAVRSADPAYRITRSTIPGLLGRVLVLPRNIGYHIEHHWYPSVPFYRLPELHARLMQEPGFCANADIQRSILASLRECTQAQAG